MTFDMKLVSKGKAVALKGLLDQAAYHRALEKKHRKALSAYGWTPENSAEFHKTFEELEGQVAATIEARTDSRENRKDEQAGIDDAKALKRKLVHAFIILHEDGIARDDDLKAIERSGPLGRSTPAILQYLLNIHEKVNIYDSDLRPFFGGDSAYRQLERIRTDLARAQGIQETNLKALPQETAKIYELKGRLLQLIERINRIGKIAFDGQALIIGEFNKDLIRRAQQRRRTESTVEPVEGASPAEEAPEGEEAG